MSETMKIIGDQALKLHDLADLLIENAHARDSGDGIGLILEDISQTLFRLTEPASRPDAEATA